MPIDLAQRFASQEDMSALEDFVAARLAAGGVWESPRVSDGMVYLRVIHAAPSSVLVCGRIYEIDQSLRAFIFEAKLEGAHVRWRIGYDRNAPKRMPIEVCEHFEPSEWKFVLEGTSK